ncbi:MAG TPA: hypothetical protein VD866_07985 [Urbifossiella sp.]|nr:hypothetical protein [Urbifossiella sp.]
MRTGILAALSSLAAGSALAQNPAASPFFRDYRPTDQMLDAVRALKLGGTGGGGGGGSPADRKYCDGKVTATPDQADRLVGRLLDGVRATADKASATLDRRRPAEPAGFRLSYTQGERSGEVTVTLTRGEPGPLRGTYQYAVRITITEPGRPTPRP